jgi:hypothetical protein
MVPILRKRKPVYILILYFFKIHFNIMLTSRQISRIYSIQGNVNMNNEQVKDFEVSRPSQYEDAIVISEEA